MTAVASLVVGMAASPGEAAARTCSNTHGGDLISATRMSCRQAHKLVRGWAHNVERDGRYNRIQFGFTCRDRPSAEEGDTMYCRKGSQRASWYVNFG